MPMLTSLLRGSATRRTLSHPFAPVTCGDGPLGPRSDRSDPSPESGQTTAEYALIILGAAAVATLVITWATNSSAISRLFDVVIDRILP